MFSLAADCFQRRLLAVFRIVGVHSSAYSNGITKLCVIERQLYREGAVWFYNSIGWFIPFFEPVYSNPLGFFRLTRFNGNGKH